MDINQISQLVNQSASNGTNSTANSQVDKDQAFTLVLEQMIKSSEDENSAASSDGSDGSDGSDSDTPIGGSDYASQMLQVMLEAIQENANKSSSQSAGNTNTLNTASLENGMSSLGYSGSTPSSLTVGNTDSQINSDIDAASKKYNVEKPLIEAVIKQESSFNPSAVSGSGAQGLMQLMPDTARSLGVTNSFDANQNIDGGTKYLKTLLDNFNGNKSLALSAYNGGIGTMQKLSVNSTSDISKMPSETSDYVKKVIGYYEKYKTV